MSAWPLERLHHRHSDATPVFATPIPRCGRRAHQADWHAEGLPEFRAGHELKGARADGREVFHTVGARLRALLHHRQGDR